jgi:hypothetical protein
MHTFANHLAKSVSFSSFDDDLKIKIEDEFNIAALLQRLSQKFEHKHIFLDSREICQLIDF